MYTAFYGLARKPFKMTPDPAFLYLTDQHREALAGLTYAIVERKGFIALSGTAGAGKTTLLSWVLDKLPVSQVHTSVILNPTLTRDEFIEAALLDFGLTDIPASKAARLWTLQKFLLQNKQNDQISVLAVDEAHKLSPELLEEIRLLGNFEAADQKLLQVVLIGQPELDDVLNRPDLWQFKQRIGVRLTLKALSAEEVGHYVQHRWGIASGGQSSPFSQEALANIARWSGGIPRLINSLCDNALIFAFADTARRVTADHIEAAAADIRLSAPAGETMRLRVVPSAPAPQPAAKVKPQPKASVPPMPMPAPALATPMPQLVSKVQSAPPPIPGPHTGNTVRPMFDWQVHKPQASFVTRWASKLGLA